MDAFRESGEIIEGEHMGEGRPLGVSSEANDRFEAIMREKDTDSSEALAQFLNMFTENVDAPEGNTQQETAAADCGGQEGREPNTSYELNGSIFETDDNGQTYKKDGELLPNTEYTVNGSCYKTDESGRLISCEAKPVYTEEGSRNNKEQKESGGEARHEDDDGGHVIAKILGGAEGVENLVPMRRTINRGDYKKMENEIAKALQEGKQVTLRVDLAYKDDSQRPSKFRAEYTIDGKQTVVEFDNDENSTELMDTLKDKLEDKAYDKLEAEIKDMAANGIQPSVTSVKMEYDENGNLTGVTVGVLDESTGDKTYYFPQRKEQE